MYILGINSAYHEPAACLIKDGRIVAAAEEERFSRVRHGKEAFLLDPHELPEQSIRYCLEAAGISADQIDLIGFSFDPAKRLAHNVDLDEDTEANGPGTREREQEFFDLLQTVPARLGALLGCDVTERFRWIEHHVCHAASTFFLSGYDEATVLSIDGIGEATSIWIGEGRGTRLQALHEIAYPSSLGMLWTKMSRFLGFGEHGQWKVMGLAGYGDPDRYYDALRGFVDFDERGNFSVDGRVLQLRVDRYDELEARFGTPRQPDGEVTERHQDIAAALQRLTTEAVLALARYARERTGLSRLCLAGGVALNCVTNRVLVEDGPFDEVFIQPAANDAGTAVGACYTLWHHEQDGARVPALEHVYFGPAFGADAFASATRAIAATSRRSAATAERVAELLAQGEIVAWFQGRMELGPRALGNRSILADPRRADLVHALNDKVKHREFFRPFAASVLAEDTAEWFELGDRPTAADAFMLCARRVRNDKLGRIPAVTHVDGTCRIQSVSAGTNARYHEVIEAFARITGVPMVLNTSFNDREPIICTPEDAVKTCMDAGIRYLVLGDELLDLQVAEEPAVGMIDRAMQHLRDALDVPVMRTFYSR